MFSVWGRLRLNSRKGEVNRSWTVCSPLDIWVLISIFLSCFAALWFIHECFRVGPSSQEGLEQNQYKLARRKALSLLYILFFAPFCGWHFLLCQLSEFLIPYLRERFGPIRDKTYVSSVTVKSQNSKPTNIDGFKIFSLMSACTAVKVWKDGNFII